MKNQNDGKNLSQQDNIKDALIHGKHINLHIDKNKSFSEDKTFDNKLINIINALNEKIVASFNIPEDMVKKAFISKLKYAIIEMTQNAKAHGDISYDMLIDAEASTLTLKHINLGLQIIVENIIKNNGEKLENIKRKIEVVNRKTPSELRKIRAKIGGTPSINGRGNIGFETIALSYKKEPYDYSKIGDMFTYELKVINEEFSTIKIILNIPYKKMIN